MKPIRRQRLIVLSLIVTGVAVALTLAMLALRQNINLFFTPTQVKVGDVLVGQKVRVGGIVVPSSIKKDEHSLKVTFAITDKVSTITVIYEGLLPDLFRENSGIVVTGNLDKTGYFQASEVLAKHDENYMPPEVKKAMGQLHSPNKQKQQSPQSLSEEGAL